MTNSIYTDVNKMLDRGWLLSPPSSGLYTVLNTTLYTSGEAEAIATTIKEPQTFKRKAEEIDELTGEVCKTGKAAEKAIELFLGIYEEKEIDKEANKQRSLRRTKSTVRQKVIEGHLDHFLTLTYKENKTDLKECWKDWKKFIRIVVKKYPSFKYLVISEFQKRGAVHFHIACHGYIHANSVRAIWLSVVGQGNIDIKRRQHNQSFHRFACYITKYITKQYEQIEDFKNLYRCSKNIILKKVKFYLPKEFALTRANEIQIAIELFLKEINQNWEDSNGLFTCRWSSSLQPT